MHALRPGTYHQPWLLCVAAHREAEALCRACSQIDHTEHLAHAATKPWRTFPLNHRLHLLVTGVGKANSAAAVARCYRPDDHAGLCVLGVAGALPSSNLDLADLVVASRLIDADTGLITPAGFSDVARMGFPPLPSLQECALDADIDALDADALPTHTTATVATVSTCSGTNDHARTIEARTGAVVEAMEGFSAATVAKRLAPDRPVIELRVVSNTTGDREAQRWDLEGALDALARLARTL